jgi:hypothetical protein
MGESPVAYDVKVIITNNTNAPLVFDQAKCGFVALNGKPDPIGFTTVSDRPGQHQFRVLPKQSKDFTYDSDGYTERFLEGAGKDGVAFVFVARLAGKDVIPRHVIRLPELSTLPYKYDSKYISMQMQPNP